MKHIALILGLTLPFTLLSCAKAEAQTAKQNVELDSLEEKIAALEAQLGTNLKHEKDVYGNERSYDSNGNLIHEKRSYGYEKWHEYGSNGDLIHEKHSDGYEEWHEYDSNGNLIHEKHSDGNEEWHEYDSYGHEIHYKNSNGYEWWNEYDSNGNLILKKDSNGNVEERIVEYDSKGNLIHLKEINRCEFLLNENGDLIYANTSGLGCDWWQINGVHYEYDPKNPNHRKDLRDGSDWYFKKNVKIFPKDDPLASELCGDYWCKYDEKGRIIYFRNEDFSSCISQSYGKCDSDGRIQEFYYKYTLGSPDTYQSCLTSGNYCEGNFRYEYYANGNLIYEHADEYGGGAHPYYKDYVFDSYGNEIFFCTYYHYAINDPEWTEYKDGKAVKSVGTWHNFMLRSEYGSDGDNDISPGAVLGGKSRLVSIDSFGNIKINEDYAHEQGIEITYY